MMASPEFLFLRETARQARRLRARQPALLFSLEHDARRGTARARGERKAVRSPPSCTRRSSGCSNTRRRRRSPRTSSASGSACATSISPIPSHILYPDFDDMLKASMVRETDLFFDEVLKNDLSAHQLHRLRLHDAQRPAGPALRHPRRGRLGVPARCRCRRRVIAAAC